MLIKIGLTLIGIFFSSLGVSLSVKSSLGATPIGVCPALFSKPIKISTGMGMAFLLSIFFIIQIIIKKKDFHPFQILQIPAALIYSLFIDLTAKMLSIFTVKALWQKVLYNASGTIVLAFGVFLMLKINFIMLPQDAVVGVVSDKYKKEYGKVKVLLDSLLTSIAVIGSLLLYKKFHVVGIGTVIAAIFVGKIISKLKNFKTLNTLIDKAIDETDKVKCKICENQSLL